MAAERCVGKDLSAFPISVYGPISKWLSSVWYPTSPEQLQDAESKILERVKSPWVGNFVRVSDDVSIWTLTVGEPCSRETPLVLIHGFISGVCWWVQNFDELAKNRTVYALDLPGFGRSSRPEFPTDPTQAEVKFVQYLEEWRKEVGLEKFVLLGHSLGGYIVSAYSLQFPDRIKHLVLSDPWGFPILPYGIADRHPGIVQDAEKLPRWFHFGNYFINTCNLLFPLRLSGPLGPWLARLYRLDSNKKTSELWKDDAMFDYIYHCNAQTPTGENAFRNLNYFLGWAKNPMIKRIKDLRGEVGITVMYGSGSFFDHRTAYEIKYTRPDSEVNIYIVRQAGHDIHVDNATEFNRIMKQVLEQISTKPEHDQDGNPDDSNDEWTAI